MARTYRIGYGVSETRMTEGDLLNRWSWRMVHPELRRRALSLMTFSQLDGHDVGIGSGARDPEHQLREALRRHDEVPCNQSHSRRYDGKCYRLKPGMSPYAFPGSSNHETGILDGFALAIDFIGWESGWFNKNCLRFGIKHFGQVNSEPWHGQPAEFPNSRSAVNQTILNGRMLDDFDLPKLEIEPEKPKDPEPVPTYKGANDMFVPIHPFRNSDTRVFPGMLSAGTVFEFGLNQSIFPDNVVAVAMNVHCVNGPPGSFLTVWGDGPIPQTSTANFTGNATVANGVYNGAIVNRKFKLRATHPMHVICDITGYWT